MCLLNKKRGLMNSIRKDYTELRGGRVNKWESLLGRLDAVGDEINRALNWTTRIEEPGSGLKYQQPNRNPFKEEHHEIKHEGQGRRYLPRSKG
jgi:hypothetical protein